MRKVRDLYDPNRCQGAAADGQCRNVSESGSKYCRACGGANNHQKEQVRLYHLTQARYRDRLSQLSDHEEVKSLREEIGLTRILIEELWNSCQGHTDLLQQCATFNGLVQTLEKLVKTSFQIEQNLGLLLAKSSVVLLGQEIIQILVDELEGVENYEDRVDRITDRLCNTIESTTNAEETS